jgi:hypothetical protein
MIGVLILCAMPRSAEAGSFARQIDSAVERGVAALRRAQQEDGSFGGYRERHYRLGFTALAVCALIHSRVPPEDAAIQRALAWMRSQKVEKTYEAATLILALHSSHVIRGTFPDKVDPADKERIRDAALWLVKHVHRKERVWSYPMGPGPNYTRTDLSNTQFAVLGLWIAEKHGHIAPERIWTDLARNVLAYQNADGGFRYAMNRGSRFSTTSMTAAGITILFLALERLPPRERLLCPGRDVRSALERAWGYMDRRFRAEARAVGGHLWDYRFREYSLHGIERIATLARRKRIAGKDWYRDGTRALLSRQRRDGGWGTHIGDTCLALLFLTRATLTYLGKRDEHDIKVKVEKPVETKAAFRASGPARPRPDVPHVRSWLLLGPFPHPGDAPPDARPPFHEARVKPRENQVTAGRKWIAHHSKSDRIHVSKVVGRKDNSLTYAFTWLHASADTEVVLWLGQDDAGRVFLDGEVVYDDPFVQGASKLGRPIVARLEKGTHELLIRIEDWCLGSCFNLRIARPDGTAPETVRPSLRRW